MGDGSETGSPAAAAELRFAFKKEQGGALGAAHAAAVILDPHAGFGSIQLEGARF